MAITNGSLGADILNGTNDADSIYGFGSNAGVNSGDTINGADGADYIEATNTGDAADDSIYGGLGDDTIVGYDSVGAAGDIIDGGDGDDVLVNDLADADTLLGDGAGGAIDGAAYLDANINNVEMVQVSNASDFVLTFGTDAIFGFDLTMEADQNGDDTVEDVGPTDVDGATFAGSTTGVIDADGVVANEDAGIVIDGTTYGDGDSFTTTGGGTVDIAFDGVNNVWQFTYTPSLAQILGVGSNAAGDETDDQTVVATITEDGSGDTFTVTTTFQYSLEANLDATSQTSDLTIMGDDQANVIQSGSGDDFLNGNEGGDSLYGYGGNDSIFAGPNDDAADLIYGGDGTDEMGGGTGNDSIYGQDGADTAYGGAGDDLLEDTSGGPSDSVGGEAWGGSGNDSVHANDGGDDILGGGIGDDSLAGYGGNDTIFGGADDGVTTNDDDIYGGDDDDLIYGGAGDDSIDGEADDDTLYNGAGDDTVVGGTGEDTLWGGAGDDSLDGGTDTWDDTFGFVSGNGNDTIFGWEMDAGANGTTGDVLDLTAFGFADTQAVLDVMSDVGGAATIALAPGQTVTVNGFTTANFQAATDDWVLV